ncbi:MAG: MurR/RpiR family transcriptional regulator [Armatimonadetes bacterium]|nr:MurR/RpiR family transcriptional regulator [Armatimonadota bacterium]
MSTAAPLRERIRRSYDRLSPARRRVADYLLENATAPVFLTTDQLASAIGTSSSTVIRCAMALGYAGFPELRRECQARASEWLRPAERLERPGPDGSGIAHQSIQQDVAHLQASLRSMDTEQMDQAVERLDRARRVFVTGARSSYAVSWFLGLTLSQIRPGVVMLSHTETLAEDVADVNGADTLIAVSLPRYTTTTVHLARFFDQRGAQIIVITDSLRAPLARIADVALLVPYESVSFFNSNVAATALANALLATLASRHRDRIRRRLEGWEDVWRYFHTHYTTELQKGGRR